MESEQRMQWRVHEYHRMERDAAGEEFIQSRNDEVLVVPLTEAREVILAVEPSPAFGERVVILPGGCVESGEAPEVTANRELQEEIGYRAARLDLLGALRPFAKYLRLTSYVFLARELSASWLESDEGYEIGTRLVSLDGFEQVIASGHLTDARVIAALYLARAFVGGTRGQGTSRSIS